jgi:Zinc finger, C2H2 type/Zinc-finger of C2H2 type
VCQECFITIEKYDELQFQSEEIQNKLTSLFVKTHSEQVYIKQEPATHLDIEIGSEAEVKLECKVCRITFFSMRDMASHRHGETSYGSASRRLCSKSIIDSSNISKNFKHRAAKQGVNYDYETFQRTFFSENEKDALMKPRKPRGEAPPPKAPENFDEKISEDFKRVAKRSGIDYNIETFQRAFGFSELESLTKTAARNAERRETYRAKNVKSDPDNPQPVPKRKKLTVNKTFVETLQESGIKYDLAAFQKAFGYSETIECEIKYDEERNKEFKELKSKGFVDCARCDLRFTNRSNFLQHMKVHKPKDPSLYCEECKRHFKTPACLQIHLATDHGRNNGPVDCPICFKSYQDRSALRSHYYIHSMERSFLCGR